MLWYAAGVPNGYGNGAIMRVSPVVLPYLAGLEDPPRLEAALATAVTHRNVPSAAVSVAYTEVLLELLTAEYRPDAEGLVRRFGEAIDMVTDGSAGPDLHDVSGRLRRLAKGDSDGEVMANMILGALEEDMSVEEFASSVDRFRDSGYVFTTAAIALFSALRHLDDPTTGLLEAVNYSDDSDSIGAVTGALLGAYAGGL